LKQIQINLIVFFLGEQMI